MKTIKAFAFLLFIVCAKLSHAQAPAPGSYVTNTTMSPFHGTWQWTSGTDTIRVYFATKKVYYPINGGYYWDKLCGWHLYKKGNTVISSSYASINNVNARTLTLGNEADGQNNKVWGFIKDVPKNKDGELTLTLNTAQNQLTWKLENSPGIKVRKTNQPAYDWSFSFPENIVLTKL